jgi:hypothetical protein
MQRESSLTVGSYASAQGAPNPRKKASKSRSSRGWKGNKTHPKAPLGGGGPGGFTTPGVEKANRDAVGTRVLDSSGTKLAAAGGRRKPPPVTTPLREVVFGRSNQTEDIEVYVEIIADGTTDDTSIRGAETTFDSTGISANAPGYSWTERRGRKVVTALSGRFELKGTITIQTVYKPGSKATDRSLYGRGTTKADIKKGNTSLGFHEYCHRQDFLRFLKKNKLPTFTGKLGQTEAAFQKAAALLDKEFKKYWKAMSSYSDRRTDEVGYKKSKCIKDGKC